ncbi:hypothetical protein INR49_018845, partial [Caranx melampygus]
MLFLSELQLPSFTPELETESTQVSYSVGLLVDCLKGHQLDHSWISCQFRCPGPGQFQCTSTGLGFVVAQEAELLYKTVQWDESLLHSVGKMAAGPLFSIQCPEDAVRQLHLPHCETEEALLCDGLLSVAHITDDGMSFIEPLEITDTHVIVSVPHLSAFGLVWVQDLIWRVWNNMKSVHCQILLFQQPNLRLQEQSLNVHLLPHNVPVEDVKAKHDDCVFIKAPSDSTLITNKTYTVHCPQADIVQPERKKINLDYGPNFHPTFQIFLPLSTERTNVEVRDETDTAVWKCRVPLPVHLPGPGPDPPPSVSAVEKLRSARTEFIQRVTEPVLRQLLDKLLDCGVVTDREMESAIAKTTRADKAQEVIDTVRGRSFTRTEGGASPGQRAELHQAGSVSCSYSISTYARFFFATEPLAGDLPFDLEAFVSTSISSSSSSSSLDSSPSSSSSLLVIYLKVAQVALLHFFFSYKLSLADVLQRERRQ